MDEVGSGDFDFYTIHGSSYELGLHLVRDSIEFEEDRPGQSDLHTPTNARLGPAYHRLRFTANVDAEVAHLEAFLDGTRLGGADGISNAMTDGPAVHIGDCAVGVSKGWRLHLDNIVVEAQ